MPRRSAASARSTSWWPFSHTSRPADSSTAAAGGSPRAEAKRSRSTPGGETTIRSAGTPSSSSASRARSVAARKQVGGRQDRAPVAALARPAVGVAPRDRLPHRQHQPEAELRLQPRGLRAEPRPDLRRVHDVRLAEHLRLATETIAQHERRVVEERAPWHPVAQRRDLDLRQRHAAEVVAEAVRRDDPDVKALRQALERPQAQNGRMVAADEQHALGHARAG